MNPFTFARAQDAADAVRQGALSGSRYLGGGTNLVDLMRETVERPTQLVDVSGLAHDIEERPDGSLLVGAAVKNTALAEHRAVRERFPLLARAIASGASGQIRNMATVAGNMLQRTRCSYFYDHEGAHCNKRNPGEGCDAIEGVHRMHAVLGASSACIATHPSDMCVALAALDAVVHLQGAGGARQVPFNDFHLLPEDHPERETVLQPGELVTAIWIPALAYGANSTYRKVRDRASYAFALVSVAAALEVRDGIVADVRLALGGVAHKPWRARTAERMLVGQPASAAHFEAAAKAEMAGAAPLRDNAFKIPLVQRTMVAVLDRLATVHS
ncbi:FAD binding domain-containing protein [Telluria beijingensis]|uniref:FAD binding domain-containing protein n=1 Tax=Telluria beijingensis TaxID=3068633 RepID=UPI0027952300|nr:xanthine dehydrogenase family protein subunit M [Massilia sp. REN29]